MSASNFVMRLLSLTYAVRAPMARALRNGVLNVKRTQTNEREPKKNSDDGVSRSEIRTGDSQAAWNTFSSYLQARCFRQRLENPAGWFGRSAFVRTACPILQATPATFPEQRRKTPSWG